jgi:hypothetical protein
MKLASFLYHLIKLKKKKGGDKNGKTRKMESNKRIS